MGEALPKNFLATVLKKSESERFYAVRVYQSPAISIPGRRIRFLTASAALSESITKAHPAQEERGKE